MRFFIFSLLTSLSLCLGAQPQLLFDPVILSGPNLSNPVDITGSGDGSGRLFVVEKRGTIRIIENDTVRSSFFLNIQSSVTNSGERGLLGLAFHPMFPDTPHYYVNYVRNGFTTQISRFSVNPLAPNSTIAGSERRLLDVQQPDDNHNGGDLAFGTDGYLYIALGDGGGQNDQFGNGQDSMTLLGAILRIDVDNDSLYAIPADNPFVTNPNALDEIWAMGLRNPWRISFDGGDLWIADVGQDNWEEVNLFRSGSMSGANYGWPCYEANDEFNLSGCQPPGSYEFPAFAYPHSCNMGCPFGVGNSITGGFVYRGSAYPALQGFYVMADFGSDSVWLISPELSITVQSGVGAANISTFGEDDNQELYAANLFSGTLYRVKDANMLPLDFVYFRGEALQDRIVLDWKTEQVDNATFFTVEKLHPGGSWESIGTVAINDPFRFEDLRPWSGQNTYRLQVVFDDGERQYSSIETVNFSVKRQQPRVENPVRDRITVHLPESQTAYKIILLDAGGRYLHEDRIDGNVPTWHYNTSMFHPGIYILHIESAGMKWVSKLVKPEE